MMLSVYFALRPRPGFTVMRVMRRMHVALGVVGVMDRVTVHLAPVMGVQQMVYVRYVFGHGYFPPFFQPAAFLAKFACFFVLALALLPGLRTEAASSCTGFPAALAFAVNSPLCAGLI